MFTIIYKMKDEEMYCQRKTFGANFLLDPDSAAGVGHLAAAIARAAEWGAERTVAVSGAGAGRGASSVSAALPRPHWVVPLWNNNNRLCPHSDMMDILGQLSPIGQSSSFISLLPCSSV